MEAWIKAVFASLLAVFAPIYPLIFATGFLIICDLITGLMAAKQQKEKITSAGLRRTVSKVLIYQAVILSAFLVEFFMLDGSLPVSKVAASIIGITELTSIVENAEIVYGEPIFSKLKRIFGIPKDKEKLEKVNDKIDSVNSKIDEIIEEINKR